MRSGGLKLPPHLTATIWVTGVLWMVVPVRAVADLVPGLEPLADKLTGKSIDYLLMLTTLAAICLSGYLVKSLVKLVKDHATEIKDMNKDARDDLLKATEAINRLGDRIDNRK